MLIDFRNDHDLEQLVQFPASEKNTLDLILTSLSVFLVSFRKYMP